MTDLLLGHQPLQRAELHLAGVSFMNSAGMAVLVQLQKMADPRRVVVVLVAPPAAVARPLQLSGLWHRFATVDCPRDCTRRPAARDPGPRCRRVAAAPRLLA